MNPKLEMAAAEIKEILARYDVAGLVLLHTPGHIKYAMNLTPSYSAVGINDVGKLRITPPIEDPAMPELSKKKIADTVNMLGNLRIYLGKLTMTLTQAEIATREHFGIKTPKPPAPIIHRGKNGRR